MFNRLELNVNVDFSMWLPASGGPRVTVNCETLKKLHYVKNCHLKFSAQWVCVVFTVEKIWKILTSPILLNITIKNIIVFKTTVVNSLLNFQEGYCRSH